MANIWKALVLTTTLSFLSMPGMIVCEGQKSKVTNLPMILQGRVYCDTCRAGFETDATTYMPGAKVRVECRNKETQEIHFTKEGITDSTGTYKIVIKEDRLDNICDVKLISSSQHDCASPDPARERSRVILTAYNGIASNHRFANSLGFFKDVALKGCDEILEKYLENDD
ncbi:hypothetical protein ACH5RR_026802 [Cinchona calisaya]|uniref:Uncharacterized protein n=1 Tax=Cinchona calisaya TaxID=153742 RepID=A0ABD2Z3M7_9GENT